ncbi:hypothetical protein [Pseudofrankia sp. DC12]|uniref:MinD/ParA family ATP-binding protein n=1 Tax=Pseudofrankia sp. DC12 TaxID=683315 RepID=UPI000B2FDA98|nr:hypothetical protein [Pseudofrankia sp. DC12]
MRVAPVTGDGEGEPASTTSGQVRPGEYGSAEPAGEAGDAADASTVTVPAPGGGGDARPVSLLGMRLQEASGERAMVRRPSARARATASNPRPGDRRLAAVPPDRDPSSTAPRPAPTAPRRAPTASHTSPTASHTSPGSTPARPARPGVAAPARSVSPARAALPPPAAAAPAVPAVASPAPDEAPASAEPSAWVDEPPAPLVVGGWVPDVGLVAAPVAPPRGSWWGPPGPARPGGADAAAAPAACSDEPAPSPDPLSDPLPPPGHAALGGAAAPDAVVEPGRAGSPDLASSPDPALPGAESPASAAPRREPAGPAGPDGWRDNLDQSGYAAWLEPGDRELPAANAWARPSEPGAPWVGQPAPDRPASDQRPQAGAVTPGTAGPEDPPRVWFGYGPPRPSFPPPGEAPDGRGGPPAPVSEPDRPGPVVYPPAAVAAPAPAWPAPGSPGAVPVSAWPAPLVPAWPAPGGPAPAWPRPASPGAAGPTEAFAAAWLRGMELAGLGVLAPVPATRVDGRRVLVGGFGGGSGRTTVAVGLGMALAALRGGRVVAVDACPDQGGPLADRAGVPGRGVGLRELAATPSVGSVTEARRFLATAGDSGLEVLPGLRDLTGPGLTAAETAWVVDLLERLFPTLVIDGPPGWTQPVPAVLLARADTVVLTARAEPATRSRRALARPAGPEPTRFTEAGCVQDALTALASARADLPGGAVVVHVETTPGSAGPASARHAARARSRGGAADRPTLVEAVYATVTIPYDPALAGGAPLVWEKLRPRTREAFTLLAEMVDEAPLGPVDPAQAHAPAIPGPPARSRARIDPPDTPTVPSPRSD